MDKFEKLKRILGYNKDSVCETFDMELAELHFFSRNEKGIALINKQGYVIKLLREGTWEIKD